MLCLKLAFVFALFGGATLGITDSDGYCSQLPENPNVIDANPFSYESELSCWNYDRQGPLMWAYKYPLCDKDSQSPISLHPHLVTLNSDIPAINFQNYDTKLMVNVSIIKQQYRAIVSIQPAADASTAPYILLAQFPGVKYYLHRINLRWGTGDDVGSEHSFGLVKFPVEIQLIHERKQRNSKPDVAQIAALSVFGEVISCEFESHTSSEIVDAIVRASQDVSNFIVQGVSSKLVPDIDLLQLLPRRALAEAQEITQPATEEFFFYRGSLTTPPCTESVFWFVFSERMAISQCSLQALRQVSSLSRMSIMHTTSTSTNGSYRPVQPLNGRTIYFRGIRRPSAPTLQDIGKCRCNADNRSFGYKTLQRSTAKAASERYRSGSAESYIFYLFISLPLALLP